MLKTAAMLRLGAGAMSLLALIGCPNAANQGLVVVPIGSQPPAVPTSSPSEASGTSSPTEGSGATAVPSVVPSSGTLQPATVSGKVYDDVGSTVSTAKVIVRSLNPANPFETTVDVNNGAYVVNNVPANVQVELTATKDNWSSRTRVESLLPNGTGNNVVNFGGPATAQDTTGPNYFISNVPEITSAVGTYTDGKLSWVVRFSEPLDGDNRSRAENALSVETANPTVPGTTITIREGSSFLSDSNQATTAWDTANTVLTFTFAAPLLMDDKEETTYSLNMVRGEGDAVIADADGKTLGFIAPGVLTRYNYAFKLTSPNVTTQTTGEDRWKATHTWSASLKLPKDAAAPTLMSVSSTPLIVGSTEYRRLALSFSKPMQVYPQVRSTSLADLANNYVFAFSNNAARDIDMAGTVSATVTGPSDVQLETSFRFTTGSGVLIGYSTTDAKVVHVDIPRSLIPTSAGQVKVRVNNLKDPAGNSIATGNTVSAERTADNVKIGALK